MITQPTLTQEPVVQEAEAFCSSNIALCKYWGKQNRHLNLPVNSSLSISLGKLGTRANISVGASDMLLISGERIVSSNEKYKRVFDWIDRLLGINRPRLYIHTFSNIPVAAGLASSASSYAALTVALNRFFNWSFKEQFLSELARLGSASAARSIFSGFVILRRVTNPQGMNCCAEPLNIDWTDFRIGIIKISNKAKAVTSRTGMNLTTDTSPLYKGWSEFSENMFNDILASVRSKNFTKLGELTERHALAMHGTMLGCNPPLMYLLPDSWQCISKVQELRKQGLETYCTMDAGPNVKLIFLKDSERQIKEHFPNIDIINPFLSFKP